MENLPATIDFNDPKMIETLKQTVAKGATDQEFVMFVELCKSSGLNPFKNEAWFIKHNGRVMIMTGINGFMTIANSYPEFDGLEVEVDSDENPKVATCRAWRKDRKYPSTGVALMKEFGRPSVPIWKEKPRVMLTKVAKAIAIREAFPQKLNNVYEESEIDVNEAGQPTKPKREAKEFRYNLEATKKFVDPSNEAQIKERLKKEFGAKFDKETGELVTKKPVAGWESALTENIKTAQAMKGDDMPDSWSGEQKTVEVPKISKQEAAQVVEAMKAKKAQAAPEPYVDRDIVYTEE